MSMSVCVCQQLNKLMPYEREWGMGRGRRFRVVARTQSQGQFSHYTCLTQKASAEIRTITACVCVRKSECVTMYVCNWVCVCAFLNMHGNAHKSQVQFQRAD